MNDESHDTWDQVINLQEAAMKTVIKHILVEICYLYTVVTSGHGEKLYALNSQMSCMHYAINGIKL